MKTSVSKNEKLTVTVEDLTYEGMGVAKVDGYPLFIAGTLPGEKIEAVVVKARKNFGFARALKWFSKSPDRVEDDAQQDGVTPKINGKLEVGFYRKGSHHFVPMKDFTIQDQRIDEILQATLTILNRYELSAYDEQTQKGLIRHLMVRRGFYSHEAMVVIVTNGKSFPHGDQIANEIIKSMPDVKSVIQNVNNRNTNVILGDHDIVLAGASTITDTLNGLKFKISAHSFYQVNPQQTEVLYNETIKQTGLTGNETVIDAYCGIGTISLNLAKHARKVYGVEIVPEAIADAKTNAQLNHIDNVDFEVGNAEEWMAKWESQGIKPDVIMVDPPRKGLTTSLIHSAAAMNPKKIVYVSCNPATLVRDIQQFMDEGYHVSQPIQPVDQFPMTQHVESITVMTRS